MKSIHNFLVLTLLLGAIITGLSQPSQPMSQIAAKAWADYKGDGLADPALPTKARDFPTACIIGCGSSRHSTVRRRSM